MNHNNNYRSPDDWMKLIQECRSSGLTDAEWCRRNSVAISSFYAAIRRLRSNACAVPVPVAKDQAMLQEVVPVSFDDTVSCSPMPLQDLKSFGTIQVIVKDYMIQISDNCARETIKNTLLALKEIC